MSEKFDDIMDVVGGEQTITYVTFVQDHSGSMAANLLHTDSNSNESTTKAEFQRNNYNEQIEVLRRETEDTETLVTLIEFDDRINVHYENKDINDISDLDYYWLGGMTALYDAIGKAIAITERKMEIDDNKNKAALIIVQTDGEENSSKEWGQKQLQARIKQLEDTKEWTFVFLGEGIDQDRMTMAAAAGNVVAMQDSFDSYNDAKGKTLEGLSSYYTMRKSGGTYTSDFTNNDESKWESKTKNKK